MKLEAVITCVNYADFLAETLPINLPYLDDLIVMTSHDDIETAKLCERYSVECFKTECWTEHGHAWNKGAGVNLGLSNLKKRDWLLHLDADIVLPHRYRDLLHRAQLKQDCIFGADRLNVYGWDNWQQLKSRLAPSYQDNWFLDPGFIHEWNQPRPDGVHMGARVIHKEIGFVPIGYHQLWHSSAGHRRYNFKLGSASGSDVFFPAQWPREKRILLPEVIVYHLDSETQHKKGTNWKGRKSKRFGPTLNTGYLAAKKTYEPSDMKFLSLKSLDDAQALITKIDNALGLPNSHTKTWANPISHPTNGQALVPINDADSMIVGCLSTDQKNHLWTIAQCKPHGWFNQAGP